MVGDDAHVTARRPFGVREFVALVAIAAAASLPWVGKAYHIDDVLYLRGVEQTLHTPTDPYAGIVLWDAKDGQPASLFLTDHNPPLWKYLLAGAMIAFVPEAQRAHAEIPLHLVAAATTFVAAFGVYFASRRFVQHPLWCTAAILLGPFFLPGQNLMLEPPLLAFSALAVVFQCAAWDRQGRKALAYSLLAGAFVAAAVLTKYTGGLLLPIFLFGCWLHRRPWSLGFLAAPLLALVGWGAMCIAAQGRPHLGAHGLAFEPWLWHLKTLNVLRTIGAVQVLGPILLLAVARSEGGRFTPRGAAYAALTILVGAAVAYVDLEQARFHSRPEGWEPSALQSVHYLVFTFHGAVTIVALAALFVGAVARGEAARSDYWLAGWLLAVLAFNVACTPFNAVRHLLLFFVPAFWLACRTTRAFESAGVRWTTLATSSALAVALASADLQMAESARQVAGRQVRLLVADRTPRGNSVWYTGNWGFVHYAQQAGAHPWIVAPEKYGLPAIRPGDYVVHPVLLTWTDLAKPIPKTWQLRSIQHWQPMAEIGGWPTEYVGQLFRTISPGVNYYSVRHYSLPWEFFLRPADEIERRAGVWLTVPTLGDYQVYEVVVRPD